MFSATYPERTSSLVLCGSFASIKAEPWAVDPEQWARLLHALEARWGKGVLIPINAPSPPVRATRRASRWMKE